MRVAGLFAGIGGLETGLSRAGHATSLLCEIWEPAKAVLKNRLPGISIESDIRELKDLPADVDLITAGFPCQDLSQAGRTDGIYGARSGLVGEIFRLLDEGRTPWVVLENVSFMLRLDGGRGMRVIIEAFESRDYRWAYRVVNSLGFVPQRRERVLFVATRTDVDPASVVLSDEAEPKILDTNLSQWAHGFYWTEGLRGLGWAVDAVPTLKNGSTIGIASPPAILLPSGEVITPDIRDAERLQGFEPNWTSAAEQVAKPSSRWSLVGNAVSVPVAEWLGGRLQNPGNYDRRRDTIMSPGGSWPRAARFDGKLRYSVNINDFPVWNERPPLHRFLDFPGKPLSVRATRGFLGRTEKAKLRFPDGFQQRLRDHLTTMDSETLFAVAAE